MDQNLLFCSNYKSIPQVQEVLDDSPFFVREDGVSIMNGANEGMLGISSVLKKIYISKVKMIEVGMDQKTALRLFVVTRGLLLFLSKANNDVTYSPTPNNLCPTALIKTP